MEHASLLQQKVASLTLSSLLHRGSVTTSTSTATASTPKTSPVTRENVEADLSFPSLRTLTPSACWTSRRGAVLNEGTRGGKEGGAAVRLHLWGQIFVSDCIELCCAMSLAEFIPLCVGLVISSPSSTQTDLFAEIKQLTQSALDGWTSHAQGCRAYTTHTPPRVRAPHRIEGDVADAQEPVHLHKLSLRASHGTGRCRCRRRLRVHVYISTARVQAPRNRAGRYPPPVSLYKAPSPRVPLGKGTSPAPPLLRHPTLHSAGHALEPPRHMQASLRRSSSWLVCWAEHVMSRTTTAFSADIILGKELMVLCAELQKIEGQEDNIDTREPVDARDFTDSELRLNRGDMQTQPTSDKTRTMATINRERTGPPCRAFGGRKFPPHLKRST
ncbi:hypothetical protein C8J57DRAFT_1230825 [Mycena rebaudengoi]|nr:hypothetical protein C8J57DRAFT_1230825 [Mycena rebaudengoi]